MNIDICQSELVHHQHPIIVLIQERLLYSSFLVHRVNKDDDDGDGNDYNDDGDDDYNDDDGEN